MTNICGGEFLAHGLCSGNGLLHSIVPCLCIVFFVTYENKHKQNVYTVLSYKIKAAMYKRTISAIKIICMSSILQHFWIHVIAFGTDSIQTIISRLCCSNEMALFDLPQVWVSLKPMCWAFQQSSLWVITLLRKTTFSCLIKAQRDMFPRASKVSSKNKLQSFVVLFVSVRCLSILTWCLTLLLLVHAGGEGVAESDGGKEHFNADDEVLPAGRHSASTHLVSIYHQSFRDHATTLQNSQNHTWEHKQRFFSAFKKGDI